MKYYKTNTFGSLIEVIYVDRETDSSIWINGRRRAKVSDYDCFFKTFMEAKAYLLDIAERKLTSAKRSLNTARGFYGNVSGLREL